MRELPILFSAPMVRAILEGRKTVTRLQVKGQPAPDLKHTVVLAPGEMTWSAWPTSPQVVCGIWTSRKFPYQVGDRLYVRETAMREPLPSEYGLTEADIPATWAAACEAAERIYYRADATEAESIWLADAQRWTPSSRMPKAWARIWLDVTDVRVERLHDITEEGAKSEGTTPYERDHDDDCGNGWTTYHYRRQFPALWDGQAKPGTTWADNPWVWVVEFRRVEMPHA